MTDLQTPFQDKLSAARAAGATEDQLTIAVEKMKATARQSGATEDQINQAMGLGQPSMAKVDTHVKTQLDTATEPAEGQQRQPITLMQSLDHAWGMSLSGLAKNRALPTGPEPTGHEPIWNAIAAAIVQAFGDLPVSVPAFVAGAIPGGEAGTAAGAVGGPIGAGTGAVIGAGLSGGATSGYVTETTRAAYIDFLQSHPNSSQADWLTFAAGMTASAMKYKTQLAGAKGAVMSAATGAAGPVAGKMLGAVANPVAKGVAITAAEMGAAVGSVSAIEGHLPERNDFAGIAGMILAAKLGHAASKPIISAVSERLQAHYVRTGETPRDASERMKTDPKFSQEIITGEDATEPGAQKTVIEPHPDDIVVEGSTQTIGINPSEVRNPDNLPAIKDTESFHTKIKLASQPNAEPTSEGAKAVAEIRATGGGGKNPPPPGGGAGGLPAIPGKPPTLDEANASILAHTTAKPSSKWDMDDFRYEAFNELQYMVAQSARAYKDATGKTLDVTKNPGELARLAYGAHGQAEADIKRGIFDPDTGKKLGKGLKEILNSVPRPDRKAFLAYWLSKRALDKESQGIETGFDLNAAKVIVDAGDKRADFANALYEAGRWNDSGLAFKIKAGMLSSARAEAAIAKDEFYIPNQRLWETDPMRAAAGRGIPVRQTMKSMKGSERPIVDPLRMLIQNRMLDRQINANNLARQRLVDFNRQLPPEFQFIEGPGLGKKSAGKDLVLVSDSDIKRAMTDPNLQQFMEDHGLKQEDLTGHMLWQALHKTAKEGQFPVFYDGRAHWFTAKDPRLIKSLESMDKQTFSVLTRAIAASSSLQRIGATSTVEFMYKAITHDWLTAPIINDFRVTPLTYLGGLADVVGHTEWFERWVANGGAHSAMLDLDRQLLEGGAYDIHKSYSVAGKMWNAVTTPWELASILSIILSDQPLRIGTFRNGIKAGLSSEEAALNSRDVVLDFSRAGRSARAINLLSSFFTARLNGADRVYQAFKTRPLQSSLIAAGLVTTASTLLWLNNRDEKWYQDLKPFQKADAWYVRLAGTADDPKWIIPIPKPPLIGMAFGTMPEMLLDAAYRDNPKLGSEIAGLWAQELNLLPTITSVTPVLEILFNYQMFTNRPLVGDRLQQVLPQYRYQPYTSETAKKLAQGLVAAGGYLPDNFRTPIAIEHLWNAYTGGLGRQLLYAADAGLRTVGVYDASHAPAPDMADIPAVRAFFLRTDGASVELDNFYKNADLADQAQASYKEMIRQGNSEEAQVVMNKYSSAWVDSANARGAISILQNLVRGIYYDKEMNPDEKRQLIDGFMSQINLMAQTYNSYFNARQENAQ